MNEYFIADPVVFSSERDLKSLFEKFGPLTGRYIAVCPPCWKKLVERHFNKMTGVGNEMGDLAKKRVTRRIEKALESHSLISKPEVRWPDSGRGFIEDWPSSAETVLNRKDLAIHAAISDRLTHTKACTFIDLNLKPTAADDILGTPCNYAKASQTILTNSAEIFLIDPFLNATKNIYADALRVLFAEAVRGKCQSVRMWARTEKLKSETMALDVFVSDLRSALVDIVKHSGIRTKFRLEMNLVDDTQSPNKMHERYLFSMIGGVEVGQGFQRLTKGVKCPVRPMDKDMHEKYLQLYLEGKVDFKKDCEPIEISL